MKRNTPLVKLVSFLVLTAALLPCLNVTATEDEDAYSPYNFLPPVTMDTAESYRDYLDSHSGAARPGKEIIISAADYSGSDYTPEISKKNGEQTLITADEGYIEWSFSVETAGLYCINACYFPVSGKGGAISRSLYIDGELPFEAARSLSFDRVWADARKEDGSTITVSPAGDQIRPEQIEEPCWRSVFLRDSEGYVSEPLRFYFSAGKHIIKLAAESEPLELRSLTLCQYNTPEAYTAPEKKAAPQVKTVKLQGENADRKSSAALIPISDRSSPAVEPSDPVNLMLNCIGGIKWQDNGQWLSWDFSVEESGYYNINIKFLQNLKTNSVSYRRILIDGKVLFAELDSVPFEYSSGWQMKTPGQKSEIAFYFEAGKTYELTLEITLGEMAEIIQSTSAVLEEINSIYREILMISGYQPDQYRDYRFDKILPESISGLREQSGNIKKIISRLEKLSGGQGENTALLERLAEQILRMSKDPKTIAKQFSMFQQNISALAAWISSAMQQPLTIDYIVISPHKSAPPKAKAGFFSTVVYQAQSFFASFVKDYNNIEYGKSGVAITVWPGNGVQIGSGATTMSGGRDQAQILKNLADNYFSPASDIRVDVQVITMSALLPATLAGKGPDVALSLSCGDICNYAFRGAAVDISKYDGFGNVIEQFLPGAMIPLTFANSTYGLPETQTFPMMFYRKDILSELGLALPETWDDVITMLPILQKKQMSFGLPSAIALPNGHSFRNLLIFLYQSGGGLYLEKGKYSALDTSEAVSSFSFMTSLYTDYGLHKEYDFLNHFRAGSVPIGVDDYRFYNQLSVFAPELRDKWDFTFVPGMKQTDGSIDRTVPSDINGAMILEKSKHKKEAWDFLKWWTGTQTQSRFGQEMESILGTAARYTTANVAALETIPWSKAHFEKLFAQMKLAQGIPEVPGGYYSQRYIDFAFKAVVNQSEDAGKQMQEAARTINEEIAIRRKEFGIDD